MGKICFGFLAGMLLMGCYSQVRFPSQAPSKKVVSHSKIFMFWGLAGNEEYELYRDCRLGNVYEVNSHTSFPQGALTVLTLGIYSPRTMEITCAASSETDAMMKLPQK